MTEANVQPEPADLPRNSAGWLLLALLMLLSVARVVDEFQPGNRDAMLHAKRLQKLRSGLVTHETSRRIGFGDEVDRELSDLESEVAATRKTDPEAAAFWVAIRTELKQPVTPADIALIQKSNDPYLRLVGNAYEMRPAKLADALPLAAKLDQRGPLSRLAATHLKTAAHIPGARTWLEKSADRYFIVFGIAGALVFLSLFAWAAYLIALGTNSVPNFGPPVEVQSGGEADLFGLRAATLLATFLVLGQIISLVPILSGAKTILSAVVMFAAVPIILRRRPTFEQIGQFRGKVMWKIGAGLVGYLLMLPIVFLISAMGALLFRNLPQAEHPAATMLMNSPSILTLVSMFVAASLLAPYWEETMFRGLIFPALRKVLGGNAAGAVASAFLFACLHPQGPGGWIGLMAFACCSCALINRTKSLLPSMVMHGVHNAVLLTIAYLIGN